MILICDDDATVRTSLTLVLKRAGYQVATASNRREVIDFVRNTTPQLILMDMNYSQTTTGEEGLELLAQVKVFCPDVPVILITAWGSITLAVKGIRAGAFDFITKPWNNIALLNSIQTAIQLSEERQTESIGSIQSTQFSKIIGKSPLLLEALQKVSRVAPTNASILITGESGSGKELIAEAIHTCSTRAKAPFVKVNLGGISQSLFESEMFGHKKGSFTDARYDRKGRFELADKGSIFLDEMGELDLVCQVKLLRVLQDQMFEPLGESKPIQIDTRIISATNRNLPEMVTLGTFREDLFYRINLITIHVPALRERRDDIPLLVEHFINNQKNAGNCGSVEVAAEGIDYLMKLPYPGNIRELKNLVERTLLITGKNKLTDTDFKEQTLDVPQKSDLSTGSIHSLDQLEKDMILKAFRLYGNNLTKIALALGITRQALYRRLEKYGIQLPE